MLAHEMLILHTLGSRSCLGIDEFRHEIHPGNLLQHNGIVDSLSRVLPPCKGTMVFTKHSRNVNRVLALEGLNDDPSSIHLVAFLDFLCRQISGAGNLTVKIVRMGGAVTGKGPARLCPGRCMRGMGMDNTANLLKRIVQLHMGGCVGGRVHLTLHLIAFQVHDHHIRWL